MCRLHRVECASTDLGWCKDAFCTEALIGEVFVGPVFELLLLKSQLTILLDLQLDTMIFHLLSRKFGQSRYHPAPCLTLLPLLAILIEVLICLT